MVNFKISWENNSVIATKTNHFTATPWKGNAPLILQFKYYCTSCVKFPFGYGSYSYSHCLKIVKEICWRYFFVHLYRDFFKDYLPNYACAIQGR